MAIYKIYEPHFPEIQISPPLSSLISEAFPYPNCSECGSSMKRIMFGLRAGPYCIHSNCKNYFGNYPKPLLRQRLRDGWWQHQYKIEKNDS